MGPRRIFDNKDTPGRDPILPLPESVAPTPDEPLPHFPDSLVSRSRSGMFDLLLEGLDKRLLVRILRKNRGDRKKTAEYLGMDDITLERMLKRHRLQRPGGPGES